MNKATKQNNDNVIENIDKNLFNSNTQTVSNQQDKFILDFKAVFPQFNPEHKVIQVSNHRVILLDPPVAKEFLEILMKNIVDYEKRFGPIR